MSIIDDLFAVIETTGGQMYGDERVTQLQHALQCAHLAERDDAGPAAVTAALFHDIGHMLPTSSRASGDGFPPRVDRRHQEVGADHLARWFGADVTEPVRLHVAAKRYLCAVEDGYFETLSPASVHSLELQGGRFSDGQADAFAAFPQAAVAVALRRWDDEAKDPNAETPPLAHFRGAVALSLKDGMAA